MQAIWNWVGLPRGGGGGGGGGGLSLTVCATAGAAPSASAPATPARRNARRFVRGNMVRTPRCETSSSVYAAAGGLAIYYQASLLAWTTAFIFSSPVVATWSASCFQ